LEWYTNVNLADVLKAGHRLTAMTLLLHLVHWIFEHSGECMIYRMHNRMNSSSIICTNDRHKTAETGGSHGGNFWNTTPWSWVDTNLLSIFRMETIVPTKCFASLWTENFETASTQNPVDNLWC